MIQEGTLAHHSCLHKLQATNDSENRKVPGNSDRCPGTDLKILGQLLHAKHHQKIAARVLSSRYHQMILLHLRTLENTTGFYGPITVWKTGTSTGYSTFFSWLLDIAVTLNILACCVFSFFFQLSGQKTGRSLLIRLLKRRGNR